MENYTTAICAVSAVGVYVPLTLIFPRINMAAALMHERITNCSDGMQLNLDGLINSICSLAGAFKKFVKVLP